MPFPSRTLLFAGLAGAGVAAAGVGGVLLVGNAEPSAAVVTGAQQCAQDRAALVQVDAELARLGDGSGAADTAREMIEVIDAAVLALKEVQADAEKVVGPVGEAQKKLDAIAEKLQAAGGAAPAGFPELKRALTGFGQRIDAGTKGYSASAPGRAASRVASGANQLGKAVETLEALKTDLQGVLAYDNARYGTGAEQIQALKYGFDRVKGALGADEVPGLGPLLDAYSQALDGLSVSVGRIEDETKAKLSQADRALAAGGSPLGVDSLQVLYPGLQSPREKMAARREALQRARAGLTASLAQNQCDKAPPPADPCAGPDMARVRALIERETAEERRELAARRSDYEARFMRVSAISLNQPAAPRPAEQAGLSQSRARLRDLQVAGRSGGPAKARADAEALARSLGVEASAPRDDRLAARTLAQRIDAALTAREAAAARTEAERYAQAAAAWRQSHAEALAMLEDGDRQRARAKADLDFRVVVAVKQQTAAQTWSEAQSRLFDQCFPYLASLRTAALPPPPASLAPTRPRPPAAAPPPRPAAAPAPAPTPAAEPAPTRECVRGGGLAGAVNDVACKVGG